jgi:hypothetical protein
MKDTGLHLKTGVLTVGCAKVALLVFAVAVVFAGQPVPRSADSRARTPDIPKLWDEKELGAMTLPPARQEGQLVYVSADYFYATPGLQIYKTYPVYRPDREPRGYLNSLKQRDPAIAFDPATLRTEADWIRAGEVVFNAPTTFESIDDVRNPEWYTRLKVPVTTEGIVPGYYYVVRKKGQVELGLFSCATCHSRVLPDGTLVSGAQGNFPVEAAYGYALRKDLSKKPEARLEAGLNFSPAERKRLTDGLYGRPTAEIAAVHEAMIPGMAMRTGFSYLDPPKIADLIGLKDRKYLDMTARLQHRSIGDVMRYGTMFGGINYFFSATGRVRERDLPDPKTLFRYTDEQAYAYSLYVYSLRPPPNPNAPSKFTERGRKVFTAQGCPACHTPPLYTNNRLTPAGGFQTPTDHVKRYEVIPISVGTDPRSAFESLRGRGYYKVPSLKGVWYRGPFEHNGSVATLEDWFDPARLRDDYVPTGFKGYGLKARAVPGHQFGLTLNARDKAALIAFLKTL